MPVIGAPIARCASKVWPSTTSVCNGSGSRLSCRCHPAAGIGDAERPPRRSRCRPSFRSVEVIQVLAQVFAEYGPPAFIRSDNGSEFIALALCAWLYQQGIQTHHIDPASPWQNAYGESFNARFRDECLNVEEFLTALEAQVIVETWRRKYNTQRPHSSLDDLPPAEFYQHWQAQQSQLPGSTAGLGV